MGDQPQPHRITGRWCQLDDLLDRLAMAHSAQGRVRRRWPRRARSIVQRPTVGHRLLADQVVVGHAEEGTGFVGRHDEAIVAHEDGGLADGQFDVAIQLPDRHLDIVCSFRHGGGS